MANISVNTNIKAIKVFLIAVCCILIWDIDATDHNIIKILDSKNILLHRLTNSNGLSSERFVQPTSKYGTHEVNKLSKGSKLSLSTSPQRPTSSQSPNNHPSQNLAYQPFLPIDSRIIPYRHPATKYVARNVRHVRSLPRNFGILGRIPYYQSRPSYGMEANRDSHDNRPRADDYGDLGKEGVGNNRLGQGNYIKEGEGDKAENSKILVKGKRLGAMGYSSFDCRYTRENLRRLLETLVSARKAGDVNGIIDLCGRQTRAGSLKTDIRFSGRKRNDWP